MKARIFIILMLIVLFTIFVTQNTQAVDINVFFWNFSSSAIIIIVITGVVGVIIGLILASIFKSSKKNKSKDDKSLQENFGKKKDDLLKENV